MMVRRMRQDGRGKVSAISGLILTEATVAADDRQDENRQRHAGRPAVAEDAVAAEWLDRHHIALVAAEHHQIAALILANHEADMARLAVHAAAPEDDERADGRRRQLDAPLQVGAGGGRAG